METTFTPVASLLGGGLIGFSAVFLMGTNGRIAGISGIVSRLLPPNADRSGFLQGIWFVVGLLLAAPLYAFVTGAAPEQVVSSNYALLAAAGVLVGFGAVLGNGCTSGHGVCGISRGSVRSISATLVFMTTAVLTVLILRHFLGGV